MRLLTIGVFLALSACTGIGGDAVETTLRCADCPEVQIDLVFDGDTVITTGDRVVRLFGVDAPERGQRCASEATKRLRKLSGGTIRLEDGPRLTDQYGRRLAYVYTKDGASIDEVLIREGLATAWTRDGQHRDHLVELEREARMKDVGCLWR